MNVSADKHDSQSTHGDGSPFFPEGANIFSRKVARSGHITQRVSTRIEETEKHHVRSMYR